MPTSAASTSPSALSDAQWRRLAETSVRRLPGGKVTPHYDPKIVMMFDHEAELVQWDFWDALKCKALCLHGAESDLLLPETAAEMERRGPRARVVTFPGIGHAPALNSCQRKAHSAEARFCPFSCIPLLRVYCFTFIACLPPGRVEVT